MTVSGWTAGLWNWRIVSGRLPNSHFGKHRGPGRKIPEGGAIKAPIPGFPDRRSQFTGCLTVHCFSLYWISVKRSFIEQKTKQPTAVLFFPGTKEILCTLRLLLVGMVLTISKASCMFITIRRNGQDRSLRVGYRVKYMDRLGSLGLGYLIKRTFAGLGRTRDPSFPLIFRCVVQNLPNFMLQKKQTSISRSGSYFPLSFMECSRAGFEAWE